MRRIAAALIGGVAGLLLVMWIVGAQLPVEHVATGSRVLPQSNDDVYRLISSVEDYARWWPEVSRVEILSREPDGRVRFRQYANGDAITMEVIERQPPTRFVTRIADPDQPFAGTWTFELEPEGRGTRLTITERGEVYPPLFRFLSRFVFGHTATIESFLGSALRAS